MNIAYFISPHGFGHASRACGVMAALARLDPTLHFEIFSKVPAWFFDLSRPGSFGYHELLTDIGLAQKTALEEDLPETLRRLAAFMPFTEDQLRPLSEQIRRLDCKLVICDISPLGLAIAAAAGLPSILVENFTWDWIYEGYLADAPAMANYVALMRQLFERATYHIQTEPICQPQPVDLKTLPISRQTRVSADQIRQALQIPKAAQVVMLTMGGIPWDFTFLDRLEQTTDYHFLVPGGSQQFERRGNLILLPHHSDFFHPDLINAADAIIGKVGYSTIAEVYQAGLPFGYIPRPKFRESGPLAAYIARSMSGLPLTEAEFEDGRWLARLPELLALPRSKHQAENGAEQAARFINKQLEEKS